MRNLNYEIFVTGIEICYQKQAHITPSPDGRHDEKDLEVFFKKQDEVIQEFQNKIVSILFYALVNLLIPIINYYACWVNVLDFTPTLEYKCLENGFRPKTETPL